MFFVSQNGCTTPETGRWNEVNVIVAQKGLSVVYLSGIVCSGTNVILMLKKQGKS